MKNLKSKVVFLVATAVLVSSFVTGATAARPTSNYSDAKISAQNQKNEQLIQSAQADAKAHPDKVANAKIAPMTPDPNIQPQRISPDEGWDGVRKYINGSDKIAELWLIGDKPDSSTKSWNLEYAYSGSLGSDTEQGFIGTYLFGGNTDDSFNGKWNTPDKWGSVSITSAAKDMVSFTTASGVSGTFSLTSHIWSTN